MPFLYQLNRLCLTCPWTWTWRKTITSRIMARHVTGSSLIAEGSNYHYKKFSSYFFTGILECICTYFYLLGHANILNFSDQLTAESFAQIDLWFIFIFNAEGSMHKRRTNVEIFWLIFFGFTVYQCDFLVRDNADLLKLFSGLFIIIPANIECKKHSRTVWIRLFTSRYFTFFFDFLLLDSLEQLQQRKKKIQN